MAVKLTFMCGHTLDATGNEEHPRCVCGEDRIALVKARAPKFQGYVLGPCAQFEELPAKPVKLGV